MSAVAEPSLVPKGTPSKTLFKVGAVGSGFNTIAGMIFFIYYLAYFLQRIGHPMGLSSFPYFELRIASHIMLIIGLGVVAVGYLGTRKNYGSSMGVASFIFCGIVSMLTLYRIVVDLGYRYLPKTFGRLSFSRVYTPTDVLFGAMLLLWALTHIDTRKFTGRTGLSTATGITLITTASVLITATSMPLDMRRGQGFALIYLFYSVSFLLFFLSEIMTTILFSTAKVSESSAKPAT